MRYWPSAVLAAVIVAAGVSTLALATDGYSVWTEEAARRQAVLDTPVPISNVRVQNQAGDRVHLFDPDHRIVLIDFIFTRCSTVCQVLGYEFKQIQQAIARAGRTEQVQLLSVSFDHARDTTDDLDAYLARHSANRDQWSAVRVESRAELNALLEQLGIVVIPDERVGFVHNAAIYLVHEHSVVGIFDFTERDAALTALWKYTARL